MNQEERRRFWDKLVSLKGENYKEESEALEKIIRKPNYLFRYRPVTIKTIEALRENRLYYSSSDYYDDPFDTFINVSIKGLQDLIITLREPDTDFESLLVETFKYMGLEVPFELIQDNAESFKNKIHDRIFCEDVIVFVRNIRNELKKNIWSVCFSEYGDNEVLWLKYAQQHKGFAVRYDLDKNELLRCGKEEKCECCGFKINGVSLYPMYYSKDMYDGTRFAQFLCIAKLLNLDFERQDWLKRVMGVNEWEAVKMATIKKECHMYDEEWRLFYNGIMAGPVCQEWIPGAVILGLNMSDSDRHLVTIVAKDAGISEVYECYITDEGLLKYKEKG